MGQNFPFGQWPLSAEWTAAEFVDTKKACLMGQAVVHGKTAIQSNSKIPHADGHIRA
jgi:hypothetical protein